MKFKDFFTADLVKTLNMLAMNTAHSLEYLQLMYLANKLLKPEDEEENNKLLKEKLKNVSINDLNISEQFNNLNTSDLSALVYDSSLHAYVNKKLHEDDEKDSSIFLQKKHKHKYIKLDTNVFSKVIDNFGYEWNLEDIADDSVQYVEQPKMDDFGNVKAKNGKYYQPAAPGRILTKELPDPPLKDTTATTEKVEKECSIADKLKEYYAEPTYENELELFVNYVIKNAYPKEDGGKIEKNADLLYMDVYVNGIFKDFDAKKRDNVVKYIICNAEEKLIQLTGFSKIHIYNEGPIIKIVFVF